MGKDSAQQQPDHFEKTCADIHRSLGEIRYHLGYMAGMHKAWGQAITAACIGAWIMAAITVAAHIWGRM